MSSKLSRPKTAPEIYWSILDKYFYNKKIPGIPPILVDNKIV